jgi:hypothetical protein
MGRVLPGATDSGAIEVSHVEIVDRPDQQSQLLVRLAAIAGQLKSAAIPEVSRSTLEAIVTGPLAAGHGVVAQVAASNRPARNSPSSSGAGGRGV